MTSKSTSNDPEKKKFRALFFIWSYIKPNIALYILGSFCLLSTSLLIMAFPMLTGQMIDIATGNSTTYFKSITDVCLVLGGVLLIQALVSFVRIYAFAIVSERAMALLRQHLFSTYVHLPMSFYDKNRTGDLLSRLGADVSQIQDVLSFTIAEFLRQISVLIIGVALLFMISVKLTTFMLLIFPLVVVVAAVFGRSIKKLSKQTQAKLADSNTMAEEILQSIASVKIYVQEKFRAVLYQEVTENVMQFALRTAIKRGLFISFIIFALFGSIVAVLWYGAQMVQSGDLSIGALTSFILYTGFIGAAAGGLGELFTQIQKMLGGVDRIHEILSEPNPEMETQKLPKLDWKQGEIHFNQIQFAYASRPEITVLQQINLHIHAGEKVAIVGPSGSGKSTLAQLLMAFYRPTSGQIYIDGQDIAKLNVQSIRQYMALVPQEILLLGGTIKDNIIFAKPDADDAAIISAAKKSGAWEFIQALPEGLETVVGDRGIRLSGGQRQRIALARAFLKNAPILILDEATSALDSESEKWIQNALEDLMQGRTVLTIAHRLSTIRHADKIVVLVQGQVREIGTHAELMQIQNGVYAYMLSLQQEKADTLLTPI